MAPQNPSQESSSVAASSSSMARKKLAIADDIVLVDDKLYSWTKLAKDHPGGELFVKAFAGRDATEAFMSYHRRLFPHDKVTHALVDTTPTLTNANYTDDYLELCAEVEKVLPRHKSFAPPSYFLKITVLLSFSLYLEYHMHSTGEYKWYLCALLGWCFALIGLNVQHDANHGSISRSPTLNRLLGMTQNWIGGSAIDWVHQHVVQHHIFVNDLHEDPDIMGSSMLRLNPLKPFSESSFQRYQFVYVFLMIAMFGFSVVITSLKHMLEVKNYTPMSRPLRAHQPFELATSALFVARWTVLPAYWAVSTGGSVLHTMLQVAPMFVVAGYWLALFFLISHNFDGVKMFDREGKAAERVAREEDESETDDAAASSDAGVATRSTGRKSSSKNASASTPKVSKHSTNRFLYRQVVTASNVGGPFLAFVNGGLNYQIEHHLFPRIQHSHYPTIAPVVRAYCARNGIPYVHYPTVWENVVQCSRHLFKLGNGTHMEPIDRNIM